VFAISLVVQAVAAPEERETMKVYGQTQSKVAGVFAVAFAAIVGCGVASAQAANGRFLVISIPDRKIALVEDGAVKRVYPVAAGKASTPSPAGHFTIARQVSDPTYSHHGRVVAPGPKNPVGSRWMGLSAKGYGIHGTNEPDSIGKAASHGCIRMAKADLEELYGLVQVGDVVEIHAERDATVSMTLRMDMPELPVAAAPVVMRSKTELLAGNAPEAVRTQAGQ
jgi:hypothetical protein